MCQDNKQNTTETKPILNTTPLGSDIINETFAQKNTSNNQTRNEKSSKRD